MAVERRLGGPLAGDSAAVMAAAEALEAALKARAPGVYSSTPLVCQLTLRVCRSLGLDERDENLAEVCARVRDAGMLALPDSVVFATGALSPAKWELLTRHPVISADLLEGLAGMEQVARVVRSHHERWDGEGYPDGLSGEEIPMLSRVIAACDGFVGMATDRPHRQAMGADLALEQLTQERGRQFAPDVVDALISVILGGPGSAGAQPPSRRVQSASRHVSSGKRRSRGEDLSAAIAAFDVLPAFGPAVERLLDTLANSTTAASGDATAVIESDIGLTLAVLRAAQPAAGRRAIVNVSDALAALGVEQTRSAVASLPRAAFPWRSRLEGLMHNLRVHSQAVSRAAQHLARELDFRDADDAISVALLHDVGKLVLGQAHSELALAAQDTTSTPEDRAQIERHVIGMDHASIGGLLLDRCGLPKQLSGAVAAHHTAEREYEVALLIRLADMIAHQAHGDAVNRKLMLRIANACGVSVDALRDVLFDLPHAGGSQRRRAQPSPLSKQETAALRRLADGKLYKQIGQELGLATSTVRTHVHNAYTKMGVADRAQAVLKATEMGWI